MNSNIKRHTHTQKRKKRTLKEKQEELTRDVDRKDMRRRLLKKNRVREGRGGEAAARPTASVSQK